MFSSTSRYHGIPTAVIDLPDGRKVTYVRRRLLPRPEELIQISEYEVRVGARLDTIAYEVFGDAEQFWRIADANRAMNPDEVVRGGRRLRITLPAGIPQGGLLGPAGSTT